MKLLPFILLAILALACSEVHQNQWQDVNTDRPIGAYLVWMRRCDFKCKPCVNPGKDSVCVEHHWIMFYEGNGKWNTEPWEAPNNPVDYKVKILSWMILPPHK